MSYQWWGKQKRKEDRFTRWFDRNVAWIFAVLLICVLWILFAPRVG